MRYRNCAELVMNVITGDKERNITQLFITLMDAHFTHTKKNIVLHCSHVSRCHSRCLQGAYTNILKTY